MKKISNQTHAASQFITAELLTLLDPKGGYIRRRLTEAGPALTSNSDFIMAAFMASLALSHAIEDWPADDDDEAADAAKSTGLN